MNNRELKKQLKNAYSLSESHRGRSFIRQHRQRGMHLGEVIRMEGKYLGMRSIASIPVFAMMLFVIAKTESVSVMWFTSSVLPVTMLAGIMGICRSEKYGMEELEATSRFSLRTIRAVRLLIIGIISIIIIAAGTLVIGNVFNMGLIRVLCCVGLPYLLNIMGCIIIMRKWHNRENLYGCCGVTFAAGFLSFIAQKYDALNLVSDGWLAAILVLVVLVTVAECILYFRESEKLSWNLY